MPEHSPQALTAWLRANIIVTIGLALTVFGSSFSMVWQASRWIGSIEARLNAEFGEIARAETAIGTLQGNIVSLDARVNEISARIDKAEGNLRARLDVLDALAKFAADRATQPNIQPPYQSGARR